MDPSTCKSNRDFQRQYNLAFSKAQAYQELIDFLASQEDQAIRIRTEIDEPEKDFSIG